MLKRDAGTAFSHEITERAPLLFPERAVELKIEFEAFDAEDMG